MVYEGTRMGWLEGFEAWRRAKFETELDIREKIKRISGGRVIGSRIQVIDLTINRVNKRYVTRCVWRGVQVAPDI